MYHASYFYTFYREVLKSKRIMKSLSLVMIWMALAVTCVFAQTEVVKSAKSVNVSVEQNDEGLRTVAISIDEDGEVKEINWEDDGTIPDDIRKMLDEEGIDVSMLEGDDEEKMMVRVDTRDGKRRGRHAQKRIVIKKDDDGEVDVLKWDGEGEMPEDIKSLLEEHDIDLDELTEDALEERGGQKRIRMRARHKEAKTRMMKDGLDGNKEKVIEYEIESEDGKKRVKKMEWIGEDGEELHIEGDHDILMIERDGQRRRGPRGRNMFFFEESQVADAYMGAQIETAEDGGVTIRDLLKDSPADQAGLNKGDLITVVNGARMKTMEDLLGFLNYFEPGDVIDVTVTRGGAEQAIKLTLGERPDAYR